MIKLRLFSCSIPKFGNSEKENEDAFRIIRKPKNSEGFHELRCAIADGATQSSFSRLWAELLVSKTIQTNHVPKEHLLPPVIRKCQEEWNFRVNRMNLPWFAEEKAKKGAFSSLLWMSITNRRKPPMVGGPIRIIAIGDSDFLLVRQNKVEVAFPVNGSVNFGMNPYLISSKSDNNTEVNWVKFTGNWVSGDDILIASDALSQYLLNQFEQAINPLTEIEDGLFCSFLPDHYFIEWISKLRNEKLIKNDDTTLIWIQLRCE